MLPAEHDARPESAPFAAPANETVGAERTPVIPRLESIPQKHWDIAQHRWSVIKPAIEAGPPFKPRLREIAQEHGYDVATLCRWVQRYLDANDLTALLPSRRKHRRRRVSADAMEIIRSVFDEYYATRQQRSLHDAVTQVQYECRNAKVKAPHVNTIRRHLKEFEAAVGSRAFLRMRGQPKRAEDQYGLRDGIFAPHEAPWHRVQIDHTKLDIMVVDEKYRRCIGRPLLTYMIDPYSRMVLGFNISLDPTGRLSTGLCMLHAMLPKEEWLKEHNVDNPWPCYGKPTFVHFDNGKEFLSEWIQRACERYDIIIEHRPVATPHFGGHIERSIRTLNSYLRGLAGATFSNPTERGEYDSERFAQYTLFELEGIITEWITGTYHRKIHRGLRRPPLSVYNEAVLGTPNTLGAGRRILDYNLRRLRLDFLPFEKRTIQHYGVEFDYLKYGGDVLSPYVKATDERGFTKKFYFHRDPRCIKEIYFYAEDVNEFFPLRPREPIGNVSLWDWRAQIRGAKETGEKEVDVWALHESHQKLHQRETEAAERTKAARRNVERRLHHGKVIPLPTAPREPNSALWDEDVEPFDNIRML
jgi:putative transposase